MTGSPTAITSERPQHSWQSGALQSIFALFLGIIIVVVVAVGGLTFYPAPTTEQQDQIEALQIEQEQIWSSSEATKTGEISAADELRVRQIDQEIAALEREAAPVQEDWARTTSILLIAVATLLLAGSVLLARVEAAWVFSTGLLLGGLFTMIYGAGWSIAAGESMLRFWVLLFALAITAGLGYLRFVRGHAPAVPTTIVLPEGEAAAVTSTELLPIEHRVAELEHTMASLRAALDSSVRT